MNRSFYRAALLVALLWLSAQAKHACAQPADVPSPDVPPARSEVALQLKQATTDEHLIALARSAEVNFFADATPFSNDLPRVSSEQKSPFEQLLRELSDRHKLSWTAFYDRDTFLLWREPEPTSLARRILAGEGVRMADEVLDDSAMAKLLAGYFRQAHGWDGRTPGFSLQVQLAELPPEIRSKVVAKLQNHIVGANALGSWKSWLSDDFWQEARMKIVKTRDGGAYPFSLRISGSVPGGGVVESGLRFGVE